MTLQPTKKKRITGILIRDRLKHFPLIAFAVLFLMLFFLKNSMLAKNAVLTGLHRAATVVLPSVFPFLVLSDLLVSVGGLPCKISGWLSPVLRLPPSACTAVLFGWICGFPIGAVCIAKEVEGNRLSQNDAERAVAAASVPSPAFLVGVVGNGLFQNISVGIVLWFFCVFSAAFVCAFSEKKKQKNRKVPQNSTFQGSIPFMKALTGAIRSSAGVSLNLCAFVTFFSVLIAAVESITVAFGIPSFFSSAIAALLELSNGILSSTAISTPFLLPFCAATCGWAGFSVHFQIFSVCEKMHLNLGKYLLAKGFQSAVCFFLAWIWQFFR
ncbi:MAG: hypothetical protein E7680_06525 [Ruminococcaceae bacterium]|nr:hypothetical protein [Oscillospiraceae bacterium]